MAEAVVEERTAAPTRFYCHMCSLEINIFNNDFTCPLCSCGFIEELPPLTPSGNVGSTTVPSSGGNNTSVSNSSIDPPSETPSNRMNDLVATLLMSRSGLAPMLGSLGGPHELEISLDTSGIGGETSSGSGSGSGGVRTGAGNRRSVSGGIGAGGIGGVTTGGRPRQANYHRLDNVFLEFLTSLSSGEDGVFGNSQMFFMGNPGDYAWGREGIDTVVTQLLNHMDTSGPPPLPKDKIAEIPTVEISETEVEQKLKCSVCWEDFKLQEAVRKLPCLHVYHENCIVPWLDLHGTCPICRKSLQLEPSTSCSMHNGAASTSGLSDIFLSPTAPPSDGAPPSYGFGDIFLQPPSVTVTASQPGTSGTATRNGTSTQSQSQPMDTSAPPPAAQGSSAPGRSNQNSNTLAFEDGNVEYDFD